ncbi:hypothetical protein HNV11_16930 [Spirosoma taeanense]|uniref:TonB C-terminal domain-containing protein n=1 Tax=Spirosoma taeanense TaxID=2735870 RepID=A0A6M5YCC2_9BACT|nr:energy transducer TonB [Spirosoma taeanense]QJW90940.1 hypothetical protein HNV11_16930 [Spirosoma taeanense]
MKRLLPIVLALCTILLQANGQTVAVGPYKIYKDGNGQILTTFDVYSYGTSSIISAAHNEVTYLGSPFLTFPIWQKGAIRLDKGSEELACELAYNLVTTEVFCRFASGQKEQVIAPEFFTIHGVTYARQLNKLAGVDYKLYTSIKHDGPTKLLESPGSKLKSIRYINTGYGRDPSIKGVYEPLTNYYIQKGYAQPEIINLRKTSILSVLYDKAEQLRNRISKEKLSVDEVIGLLTYYDSLVTADFTDKSALMLDPVFTKALHHNLTYPASAQNQAIYGRVYAAFDINEQGLIRNVTILSPENAGYRFDLIVKKALQKISPVDPALNGKYILPVAFTYTNTNEDGESYIPVNRLSGDRLSGRQVLEEYIVPAVVARPSVTAREVWGYYK